MFPKTRLVITSLAVVIALLAVVTIAYAAMYVINTDDDSIDEWSAQSIASFQTDPASDFTTATHDIINVWVARSTTNTLYVSQTLNFMMEVNASPAISANDTAAAAILDCDQDGVANDPDDRIVAYFFTGDPMYIADDAVYVASGDFDSYWFASEDSQNDNPLLGQAVDKYVEWGVPLSDLDQTPGYCQSTNLPIRFATIRIDISGWLFPTMTVVYLDDILTFRGYNVPTAVRLESLEARARPTGAAAFGLVLGLVAVLGVMVVARSRRR